MEAIPSEWSHASARKRFDCCLQRLKTDSLVQNVIETIADDLGRRAETEAGNIESERKHSSEILRPGPQDAGFGRRHAHLPHCV